MEEYKTIIVYIVQSSYEKVFFFFPSKKKGKKRGGLQEENSLKTLRITQQVLRKWTPGGLLFFPCILPSRGTSPSQEHVSLPEVLKVRTGQPLKVMGTFRFTCAMTTILVQPALESTADWAPHG